MNRVAAYLTKRGRADLLPKVAELYLVEYKRETDEFIVGAWPFKDVPAPTPKDLRDLTPAEVEAGTETTNPALQLDRRQLLKVLVPIVKLVVPGTTDAQAVAWIRNRALAD